MRGGLHVPMFKKSLTRGHKVIFEFFLEEFNKYKDDFSLCPIIEMHIKKFENTLKCQKMNFDDPKMKSYET